MVISPVILDKEKEIRKSLALALHEKTQMSKGVY